MNNNEKNKGMILIFVIALVALVYYMGGVPFLGALVLFEEGNEIQFRGEEIIVTKMIDNVEFLKEEQKKVFDFLGSHTKLTKADLEKARNGELWLNAKDCLKKGIVDRIV